MIEIADDELPNNGAPLTISEARECLSLGLISPTHGDLIFEWRNPDDFSLAGRVWAWRNGEGIEATYDFTGFLVRAVYFARRERMN